MNIFPLTIENIIIDYKYQLEHTDNFKLAIKQLDNIFFKVNNHFEENIGYKIPDGLIEMDIIFSMIKNPKQLD